MYTVYEGGMYTRKSTLGGPSEVKDYSWRGLKHHFFTPHILYREPHDSPMSPLSQFATKLHNLLKYVTSTKILKNGQHAANIFFASGHAPTHPTQRLEMAINTVIFRSFFELHHCKKWQNPVFYAISIGF